MCFQKIVADTDQVFFCIVKLSHLEKSLAFGMRTCIDVFGWKQEGYIIKW
jgi:hypothetical protein